MLDESDDKAGHSSQDAEPSAKDQLEGELGDVDKLVMMLAMLKTLVQPPSPMGAPVAGSPALPSPGLTGSTPLPMGASMPPPPMMGAGGPPPMGGGGPNPMAMLQQQLQSARGLV